MKAHWEHLLNLVIRIGLFAVILCLGTVATWAVGGTGGPTLAPAETMTTAIDDQVLYAALIDDMTSTRIYRSEDRGRTWLPLRSEVSLPVVALTAPVPDQMALYTTTATGGLWRSQDEGHTWLQFTRGMPNNPYGLPPVIPASIPDSPPRQVLSTNGSRQGDSLSGYEQNRYSYELVGGISLYNYRVYAEEALMGPDGRVYPLTGSDRYVTEGDTWPRLALLLRLAIGLPVSPVNLAEGGEAASWPRLASDPIQDTGPSNGWNGPTGPAVYLTALAQDEPIPSRYVAAVAIYDSRHEVVDKGIYVSSDNGRHWLKLAEASGLMVLQVSTQPLAPQPTPGLEAQEKLMIIRPSLVLPPLRTLSGTQLLILFLTLGLAGLTLLDKNWAFHSGRAPV